MVRNTIYTFIKELSREECLNIHRRGSLKTASWRIIANIKPNVTTKYGDAVAGNVDDGEPNCQGEYFTDGMNEWHNVIVQYAIRLLIRDFSTPVIASRNSIVRGLRCATFPTNIAWTAYMDRAFGLITRTKVAT